MVSQKARQSAVSAQIRLDGTEIVYLARMQGHRRGQYEVDRHIGVAARLPASLTAIGKVLLSCLSDAERELLIAKLRLSPRGPGSITSKKALREELARIRTAGIAVSVEEIRGVCAIAAPIAEADGRVIAGIEVAMPAGAFLPGLVDSTGARIKQAAQQISALVRA